MARAAPHTPGTFVSSAPSTADDTRMVGHTITQEVVTTQLARAKDWSVELDESRRAYLASEEQAIFLRPLFNKPLFATEAGRGLRQDTATAGTVDLDTYFAAARLHTLDIRVGATWSLETLHVWEFDAATSGRRLGAEVDTIHRMLGFEIQPGLWWAVSQGPWRTYLRQHVPGATHIRRSAPYTESAAQLAPPPETASAEKDLLGEAFGDAGDDDEEDDEAQGSPGRPNIARRRTDTPVEGERHRVLPRFSVSLLGVLGLLARWAGMVRGSGGRVGQKQTAALCVLKALLDLPRKWTTSVVLDPEVRQYWVPPLLPSGVGPVVNFPVVADNLYFANRFQHVPAPVPEREKRRRRGAALPRRPHTCSTCGASRRTWASRGPRRTGRGTCSSTSSGTGWPPVGTRPRSSGPRPRVARSVACFLGNSRRPAPGPWRTSCEASEDRGTIWRGRACRRCGRRSMITSTGCCW